MNRRRLVIFGALGALAALLLVIFYLAFGTDPHSVPFGMKGKPAPGFKMVRLDTGEEVSLDQFKGRPVVINFWATWCGPCKAEHPTLHWAYEKYKDQASFIGIVFEDTEDSTKKFLRENGESFPQLFDRKSTVAVDYAVTGVPETYFIDKNGIIVDKYPYPISQAAFEHYIHLIL